MAILGRAVFAAAFLAALPAHAEPTRSDHPIVRLGLLRCPRISTKEVRRILALELHMPVEPLALSETVPSGTSVRVNCGSPATLRLSDALTSKVVTRTLELQSVPSVAQPRLLALSVAELISASWAELELTDGESGPAPTSSRAALRAQALGVVQRRRVPTHTAEVVALGVTRAFGIEWHTLGAGFRITTSWGAKDMWEPGAWLGGAFEHASYSTSVGRIGLDLTTIDIGVSLGRRYSFGSLQTSLGGQLGRVAEAGTPSDNQKTEGRSGVGWVAGPKVAFLSRFLLSKRLFVEVAPSAGYVALPVGIRVLNARAVTVGGFWMGGTLGVGFAF